MSKAKNNSYDWNTWFRCKSKRFTLHRGVHYHCTQTGMAQQVRNAASDRGLLVSIVDTNDGLTVFVRGPSPYRRGGKGDRGRPAVGAGR